METFRIALAVLLAAGAAIVMVDMEAYADNLFRNTLQSWFGAPGQTVAMVVAGVYAAAVFAFMSVVAYTTVFIFESGLKE